MTAREEQLTRLFEEAAAAHARHSLDEAERLFGRVLTLAPGHGPTLHFLGLIAREKGRITTAVELLQRAVSADPSDAIGYNNLGNALLELGREAEATDAYAAAVRLAPDYPSALFNLAKLEAERGELGASIGHYRRALDATPGDVEGMNDLGLALMDAGRMDEARATFEAALAIAPNHPDSNCNLGICLAHGGWMEEARECYERAIAIDPRCARAYENLVRTQRFESADDPVVRRLEALAGDPTAAPEILVPAHFALGKLFDDCGEYDRAFEHYCDGNRLMRETVVFDAEAHRHLTDRLIASFSRRFVGGHRGWGRESTLPVFVIGMLRSGTTLVEQILASHPRIAGGGELLHIRDTAVSLAREQGPGSDYPECVERLDRARVDAHASRYLQHLREVDGNALRVTDKLPTNYLYLGLIALMFPRAAIVHCRRHPLDVGLSIYCQRFAQGHQYAYDLREIAVCYQEYERLMHHWRETLDVPLMEVCYESLVVEQVPVTRDLLAHCGVEWDERCLRQHETQRVVSTASDWQVRQPVYRSSVGRWRHYREFLHDLAEPLESCVEAYEQDSTYASE